MGARRTTSPELDTIEFYHARPDLARLVRVLFASVMGAITW